MDVPKYLYDAKETCIKLNKQSGKIIDAINILKEVKKKGNQVFLCGNGGSAGTASHMKADLFKISKVKAISLDDNVSLMTALINDEGWNEVYVQQLERLFNPDDVLIAISVHGGSGEDKAGTWSQNLNKAISYVKMKGGKTIGFSGFDGGQMKYSCDVCIVVPAESTPLVESFHGLLHHIIAFELQEGNRK